MTTIYLILKIKGILFNYSNIEEFEIRASIKEKVPLELQSAAIRERTDMKHQRWCYKQMQLHSLLCS